MQQNCLNKKKKTKIQHNNDIKIISTKIRENAHLIHVLQNAHDVDFLLVWNQIKHCWRTHNVLQWKKKTRKKNADAVTKLNNEQKQWELYTQMINEWEVLFYYLMLHRRLLQLFIIFHPLTRSFVILLSVVVVAVVSV